MQTTNFKAIQVRLSPTYSTDGRKKKCMYSFRRKSERERPILNPVTGSMTILKYFKINMIG
jgi:hypothetical protein